jgi:hypothetical protein
MSMIIANIGPGGCVRDDFFAFPQHYFAVSQLARFLYERDWNTDKEVELILDRLEHAADILVRARVDMMQHIIGKHNGEDTYELVYYTLRELGVLTDSDLHEYDKTWVLAQPVLVKVQQLRFQLAANRLKEILPTDAEELAKFFDTMADLDMQYYEQTRPSRGCFG